MFQEKFIKIIPDILSRVKQISNRVIFQEKRLGVKSRFLTYNLINCQESRFDPKSSIELIKF